MKQMFLCQCTKKKLIGKKSIWIKEKVFSQKPRQRFFYYKDQIESNLARMTTEQVYFEEIKQI